MNTPGTHSAAYPPARLAWLVWGLGALLYLIAFYQRVAPAVMTDRLMSEFALTAAALGNLSAFYFYSYVVMQIPTGLIADRWGARRLLIGGAGIAALGTLLFALAPTLLWASLGRLLIGASVAVAFVSMLKLASRWFAPQQFALASGMALFIGVVGGVFAGVPLRLLVEAVGWRQVMLASALVTALLCLAIWRLVRDDPGELGFRSHGSAPPPAAESLSVWRGLAHVLAYRNLWLLLLTPIGVAGSVLTFAGLWGVPYLIQQYGLDTRGAAGITSALLVSWALGGPLLGAWSQRMGKRKPLYVASTLIALIGWSLVVYLPQWRGVPFTLTQLVVLLVLTGFASGNLIIGFAFAKESVPLRYVGTASGVCNMGPLLGGMLLQPGVGWLLDRHWQGGLNAAGNRVYDAAAWQAGFGLMVACLAASLLLILFTRETACRQTP